MSYDGNRKTRRRSCVYSHIPLRRLAGASAAAFAFVLPCTLHAQQGDTLQQQVQKLASAVALEQQQLEASQNEIQALRQQVANLQAQLAGKNAALSPSSAEASSAAAELRQEVDDLREQQAAQQEEIAVQNQKKVETQSQFPVRISGLIVANGYSNSGAVDFAQAPTYGKSGNGATGISLQQSIFTLEAHGPHLWGAATHGDVSVDFFGGLSVNNSTFNNSEIRLRTAHANLDWAHTKAFVNVDRPIVSPNTPTSLTALAVPALGWSGNLWNWIPQVGASHSIPLQKNASLNIEGAIADVPDAPYGVGLTTTTQVNTSQSERSHWPASELRIGYNRGDEKTGLQIGLGGYFSPHGSKTGHHYDAWAATGDYRIPFYKWFELSGSVYRGLALGGLGNGTYKDALYTYQNDTYQFQRPLNDVGGWSQFKFRPVQRLQFNAAYGLDNSFSHEFAPYEENDGTVYANMWRNAEFFTNTLYSPTSYTIFSFEYRKLDTSYATGQHSSVDVYGLAAGYKF